MTPPPDGFKFEIGELLVQCVETLGASAREDLGRNKALHVQVYCNVAAFSRTKENLEPTALNRRTKEILIFLAGSIRTPRRRSRNEHRSNIGCGVTTPHWIKLLVL
ncbi:hypothetical protein MTP99_010064 [Tenebrio molitor]|jgi:hypothetical protein|nr:hypothetical protein MTP99_010064 [Tenebrio molitor]